MLSFIIFLLSSIGLTMIITHSYIFKPLRKKINSISPFFGKLINCCQCTGFYVSIIIEAIIFLKERNNFIFYWSDFYYILYGFIGSFVCYLTYLMIKPLMDKYD